MIRDVDHVPHVFGVRTKTISIIMYLGVTVVNLEKAFSMQVDDVLYRDGIVKIRMVDVGEHGHSGFFSLFQHSINIALHDFRHTLPTLWCDEGLNVGRIHMDGLSLKVIGNLL